MFRNFQQTGVTKPLPFALIVGLFAGLIWGGFRLIAYYCNFTKEPAAFLIKMWLTKEQLISPFGHIVGTISFIVFSILATYLYLWFFRTLEGPWPGIWYGLGWWGILFGLGPILGFTQISRDVTFTLASTDFCFFIVWGLFIGYSIAFEFTDEASREPASST
ncbi:YqhR family membrane protein [Paenibacillus septentrionalis]|uniref:YqhR family membrane protein n=1 Tax=Paenibacillus septentrionalis TaxID=429342 RepID=A0ABW1V4L1_9BACL